MPDIKPEVNKEPEKKPGILSGLFGGGGGGSGAAGIGGLGSSAAGGGVLATKAGLLALVLVGTTVAGGIGLVGYKVFGPGESDMAGQNIQLFSPKPKEAAPDASAAAAPKDGNSASLDGFAKVNSGALRGDAPAVSEAAADETAASASSSAGSAGSSVSNAVAGAGGNGASTSMLKGTKKLGALSSAFGGGAGSAPSAGSSSKAGDAPSLAAAGKGGQLGGPINTTGRGVAASNSRSIRAGVRRSGGAKDQARFARNMGQQNQYSMRGAGQGFENSSPGIGGENIGGENTIGMGGAGAGQGGEPTSLAAPASGDVKEVKPAEPPPTYDVTPYAKEMQIAQLLLMLAAGILYYASTVAKAAKVDPDPVTKAASITLAIWLCRAAMALGAVVAAIGLKIAGGEYDQKTQGLILGAAGAGIAVAAWMALSDSNMPSESPALDGSGTMIPVEGAAPAFGSGVVMLGGGAALIGLVGNMLAPPKTCKSPVPDDASQCTSMVLESSGAPSEKALEEYLV